MLVGYALFVIVRTLATRRAARSSATHRWVRPTLAIAVILVVVLPFATVAIKDAQDPYGHLYYGHLQPTSVTVDGALPLTPTTSAVYRHVAEESRKAVIARLESTLGVSARCTDDAGTANCAFGSSRFFVHPDGDWAVDFVYADPASADAALVPPEAEARADAEEAMQEFGIDPSTLRYIGLMDFGDKLLHLKFATRQQSSRDILWGDVMGTIGDNGAVRDITDSQLRFTWVQDVQLIPARAALEQAQEFGIQQIPAAAEVSSVEPSFTFNPDTGYLVPTWQIIGKLRQAVGPTLDWTPAIDARAH